MATKQAPASASATQVLNRALRPYELPLPGKSVYDPNRVGEFFVPDYGEIMRAAHEYRLQYKIKPRRMVPKHLLVGHTKIDDQGTFILDAMKNELVIGPPSVDDTRRAIEFDIRNRRVITDDMVTLDTHYLFQIFHPLFWLNADGSFLENEITVINSADVGRKYMVNPEICAIIWPDDPEPMRYLPWLRQYALHYCQTLEKEGKPPLVVWKMHSRLGHPGHCLVPSLAQSVDFCDIVRWAKTIYRIKGDWYLAEHYSPFGTEVVTVTIGGHSMTVGELSDQVIADLFKLRVLFLSGQALSHCVRAALLDIIRKVKAQDPTLASKIYLLVDCSSAVPGPVFEALAQDALDQADAAKIHIVKSTTPLDEMPDFPQEVLDFALAA